MVHYITHSLDYPSIAELGLKAACAYAMQLLEIAKNAEASRPELAWARGYVGRK